MYKGFNIAAIIPAYNTEKTIGNVIFDLGFLQKENQSIIDHTIVCDNGSTDNTPLIVQRTGATLVHEPKRGYGAACLKALTSIPNKDVDFIIFLNGDGSEIISEVTTLLDKLIEGADLVIGSRHLGSTEKGALLPQEIVGNQVAAFLIRLFWSHSTTDLGPFRAIRYDTLLRLKMQDTDYGWSTEMQIKAIRQEMNVVETPITTRKAISTSNIPDALLGTLGASKKILSTILFFGFKDTVNKLKALSKNTPLSSRP